MKSSAVIQKDVYDELKFDPRIREGEIGVSVAQGVVTLSGSIPTFAEKWAAEEAALKVAGVATVVNDLKVKITSSKEDDQEIAEAINRAFKWNVWIPKDSIKTLVDDGWVTLSGKLDYNYQKEAAQNAVKTLPGVRGVSNKITVEPKASIRDIKAHIRRAIHRYADKDANAIDISVADGEVRLSGTVHSRGEKSEAEFAAWQTPGVRTVKNNISVAYEY
jgi:osmotically-inducible protein OsmY